jgi:DNA-binding HxlR family transcriptional regulator
MERKSFSDMDCSVAQCLEVVGEWWSLLIVRDAFFGVTRFDDFQRSLGISRNVLHQRLEHLIEAGVLKKLPYSERPPRSEYRLTEKGRDLWGVLTAMRQWGDRYASPNGQRIELVHQGCGATTDVQLVCASCGDVVTARDVVAVNGPGRANAGAPRVGASTRSVTAGPRLSPTR